MKEVANCNANIVYPLMPGVTKESKVCRRKTTPEPQKPVTIEVIGKIPEDIRVVCSCVSCIYNTHCGLE